MSDKLFAVQYRCGQTNQRSIAVFSAMSQADDFFAWVDMFNELPTKEQIDTSSCLGIHEIAAEGRPPTAYHFTSADEGTPLEYCNIPSDNIPELEDWEQAS